MFLLCPSLFVAMCACYGRHEGPVMLHVRGQEMLRSRAIPQIWGLQTLDPRCVVRVKSQKGHVAKSPPYKWTVQILSTS